MRVILRIFLLHMRATAIFPLPIWGRFQLIFFHQKSKTSAIFVLMVYLAYWPRKRAVLSHQRWSFPPSLKLIRLSIAELQCCWCGYITWPCDLDLLSLNSNQTWLVTRSTPQPSLKILCLSVLELWVMMSAIGQR